MVNKKALRYQRGHQEATNPTRTDNTMSKRNRRI